MPSDTAHCAASRAGFEDKTGKIIEQNDLQLLIVDATEQRIERPKNQRAYYSGKKHAHTIKTEIVTDSKGRILRVSKPYEGRVHDFEIRKTEGPLPAVPILTETKENFLKKVPLNLQKLFIILQHCCKMTGVQGRCPAFERV